METVDNVVSAGQVLFLSTDPVGGTGGQPGASVDTGKFCTPDAQDRGVLPRAVPSFTQVPHSPTDPLGVTPFTRRGERRCRVAEQWTEVWRSGGKLGTRRLGLWVAGGQLHPRPVDEYFVHRLWIIVDHKSPTP